VDKTLAVDDLTGRVAVVTGAASGIGLGIAEAFARARMRLVLADIDGERLEEAAESLRQQGAEAEAVVTDVGDPAAVDALAEATLTRFGGVHVVCNNAGTIRPGRTWELPLADWELVLRVNLFGVVHGVHTFVPHLLRSGEPGHVVNVASMAAVVPVPGIGPYNVSKHGVLALSEVLRAELLELGAPIGVTVVMPGRVRTRLGLPRLAPGDEPPDTPAPEPGVLEPSEIGRQVVEAIRENLLYLFTHPERLDDVRARFNRIVDAGSTD
jgi:NAD(P)-dependent dehydrogenase (short-subunit alcohol dehydrogenase family)